MDTNLGDFESLNYNFEAHWNNAYLKTPVNQLGWHETNSAPSFDLINECNLPSNASIFNAGAGATTLIKKLLDAGFINLIVNDIAASALTELSSNLSKPKNSNIQYIVDDLTKPIELLKLKNIDLWHDRAVLHFFTEKRQQDAYFNLLKKVLKPTGYVILAEFNLNGAEKCNGLTILNYNEKMLQDRLGEDFKLIKSFNYTYIQPSGNTREYVYALFQRQQN